MQLTLFDTEQTTITCEEIRCIELVEIFEAYFNCRQNKRNTTNAIAFEVDYESNLVKLHEEINNRTYQPGRSIAFIVDKPVQREIFAADFRDRVVHHLIFNKLNPLFEKTFIYDSYACRIGKGTHLGIQRVNRFIRQCSQNYSTDCYILKLDIQGFFMHINKNILFEKLQAFIHQKYLQPDKELVLELCQKVIYNDPTHNCTIKGKRGNWDGLPADKSLFHSPLNCGLPIGNLTSQVFANFYMNIFDHFVKHDLGIRYYSRYVDDFVLVHQDKDYLKSLIPILSNFLLSTLQLTLHPKKIYLQHYTKGVKFLGAIIKPNCIYIANRTKGNFYEAIEKQNEIARNRKPTKDEQGKFISSMNSYLGIMKHYNTYKLRKVILFKNLAPWWWNWTYLSGGMAKFALKQKTSKH
jgi:retron-type reverse transcriptase